VGKWEMVRLGDVCVVERGGSPRPIEKYITEDENGINWIKIGDTTEYSMYITKTKEKIIPDGVKKSRRVKAGDFLLTNSMSFGRPYILKIDGCIHDGWLLIRDEGKLFDKRFLYYHLSSDRTYAEFKGLAVGGVVNNLNSAMVRNLQIPLPPHPIQQKIADVLDRASTLIEKRKAQIAKLDLLVKSQFIEMFGDPITNPKGWEISILDVISEIASGITKGRKLNGQITKDVPYMRVANVKDGHIDLSEVKTIAATNDERKRYALCPGDVLLTEGGDPDKLGRGAIWKGEIGECIHQNHIFRVRLYTDVVTPIYFASFLSQASTKAYFLRAAKQTTGIASINMTQLKGLPVHLPPITIQNEFARFVECVEAQKEQLKKSLDLLELNYKSLMQKCFSGDVFK